ncbi:helix-turn-helix domain-containing protein [Pseudomonas tohonis]|uniref:HTH cro/C1-type domain-containing protein n=1 Tax=Pseudomonas tohonis TaxID=2725477 RepID=A0ABQ4VSY7_9PSED|nr:transcriptional regulator [Pseudomonas tohonis]GJN50817.1 hypothetical protein TUM20286_05690 [Pseudomonas tohonis]
MYHYVECGLPNVWLRNGFVVKDTAYGEAIAIEDVEGLHKVIGKMVAEQASRLSGAEFRFLRKELALSQESLADIIDKSSQAVALWEKNDKVPMMADRFIRGLYLEATTGNAKLMEAINHINQLDHDIHNMSLSFDDGWKQADKAA